MRLERNDDGAEKLYLDSPDELRCVGLGFELIADDPDVTGDDRIAAESFRRLGGILVADSKSNKSYMLEGDYVEIARLALLAALISYPDEETRQAAAEVFGNLKASGATGADGSV